MPKMPKIETPKTIEEIVLPTVGNSDGSYTCCYCDVVVKRKYDLKRHVVGTHINARLYRCAREGAGCTFSGANQKGNLTQHYNNSPECNMENLRKEAEDAASKQVLSPAKAEVAAVQLYFEHPVAHFVPTTDEPEIPASVRVSVTQPKKPSRLGTHRTTPYSTSRHRGPPASEAFTSRPSRRQVQVVSDISAFNFQLVLPTTHPQSLSTHPVQQYQCFSDGNYPQVSQNGGWQSGDLSNTWFHDSLPQSPQSEAPQEYVLPQISGACEEFSSTLDPTPWPRQDSFAGFDHMNALFPTTSSSVEDEALQTLFAATYTSGGIDYQEQVGPVLQESSAFAVETTLPQSDYLDLVPLDTTSYYERIYLSWKTGDQSWPQLTASADPAPELDFDWAPSLDDRVQRNLTAGYTQNFFSHCPSSISGLA